MKKIKIEYKKIDSITPYINNPRNNDDAVEKVAASINEFGFKNPIVIDKSNTIVNGHTRYKAAKKIGLEEVPTISADDLTEAQIKAFRIADNKTGEFSEWDNELLKIEFEGLKEDDYDIGLTGFDYDELNDILNFEEEKDLDDIEEDEFDEEPPENPISKNGDVWLLGRHRLMCGDSTSEKDVKILLNKNKIELISTDPPYGMNAVSKSSVLKERYGTDILNDDDNKVAIKSFELCQKLGSKYQVWWGANYYSECLPSSECWIVWDKNNGGSDQTDCELAWTNFRSVVRQFTQASEKTNRIHPTQKPVKLIYWLFKKFDKYLKDVENVLDLFGGSGFTLIGCEMLNINSFLMELDTKFVDLIIQRYINFKENNGEDVYLIRDGEKITYEDVKK